MLTEIPRYCNERLDVATVTGFTVEPSPELICWAVYIVQSLVLVRVKGTP